MSYRQLPAALRIGFILAVAAIWLFHEAVPIWSVSLWFVLFVIVSAGRYLGLCHISTDGFRPQEAEKYAKIYVITAFLLGSLWALLAFLVPFMEIEGRITIFVLLISIAGGALTTNAGHIQSFYAYMLPIMLAYTVQMFRLNESVWLLLGTLTLVYTIYLILAGWKLYHSIQEAIELRCRWQAAASDLEETRESLHNELEIRRNTEKKLKSVMTELELAVEHLEQLAAIDELTGLSNRRSFDAAIALEWNRARRGQTAIALLMIDVDYFKSYNDYYHHQRGDDALKEVARVLKHFARRPGDVAARYGGEEFALILANPTAEHVVNTADSLVEEIRNLKIPHEALGEQKVITVSIGTARIEGPENDDYSNLIQEADRALYNAKSAGRDRVVAA